ncbi:MAG: hypothetical protein AAF392_02825 [Bacteroidota bacterium]
MVCVQMLTGSSLKAAKLGDMQEVARLLEEQGADIETRDYKVEHHYTMYVRQVI